MSNYYGDEQLSVNEFLARQNQFREWDDNLKKAVLQWFVDPKSSCPTFESICPYLDNYSKSNSDLKRWIRNYGMEAVAHYDINKDCIPGPFYIEIEHLLLEAAEDLFQIVISVKNGDQFVIRRGAYFNKQLIGEYGWGTRMYDDMFFSHKNGECSIVAGTEPMCGGGAIEINLNDITKIGVR